MLLDTFHQNQKSKPNISKVFFFSFFGANFCYKLITPFAKCTVQLISFYQKCDLKRKKNGLFLFILLNRNSQTFPMKKIKNFKQRKGIIQLEIILKPTELVTNNNFPEKQIFIWLVMFFLNLCSTAPFLNDQHGRCIQISHRF